MIRELKLGVFLEGHELRRMIDEDEELALNVEPAEVIKLSSAPVCLREALDAEREGDDA